MELTKRDIELIDGLLVKRINPIEKRLGKIEKKFDDLFDFLDKKYIEVKRDAGNIQSHLHLPVSDF